jgi:two-component system, NtrC family, response regulator PilR
LRHRIKNPIEIDTPTSETDYFKYIKMNSVDEFLDNIEREIVVEALERSQNNKTKAADLLGISFRSFRYKLQKYNLADKDR